MGNNQISNLPIYIDEYESDIVDMDGVDGPDLFLASC
jgi:hypothetical protein